MRLERPAGLSIHEKNQWDALMDLAPIGHFLPVDVPAILDYCQLKTLQTALYPKVFDGTATPAERDYYLALMAQLKAAHRNLRIGPSTRNAQRDRAGRNARDHVDGFEPGTDWREMVAHGRGGRA
jgi:hypothetical protein